MKSDEKMAKLRTYNFIKDTGLVRVSILEHFMFFLFFSMSV